MSTRAPIFMWRRWLLVCALGLVSMLPIAASAAEYPNRPIRILVGFAPGGASSLLARLFARSLTEQLGQPVVVENKPGAGSSIAAAEIARSKADGYSLTLVTIGSTINHTLYRNLKFDVRKDFALIGLFGMVPNVVVVRADDSRFKTAADYLAFARSNPGKVTCGTAGVGTGPHLACELLKLQAKADILSVPYNGTGPLLTGFLAGDVDSTLDTITPYVELVKAGKARTLAVTSATRSPLLPGVPTLAESGVPGFEMTSWLGLAAPKGTPAEVVEILNGALNKALRNPSVISFLKDNGYILPVGANDPAAFEKLVLSETEKWGAIIRRTGISIE